MEKKYVVPDGMKTTLCGHTKQEWHAHIDEIFGVATPGEGVPESVLLAWRRELDDEDIAWANLQSQQLGLRAGRQGCE